MPSLHGSPARRLGLAVLAGLLLFCISMGVSAMLYPGGTWFDRTTVGHRFWENFWCDLLRARSHNGAPNTMGSRIAFGGWLVLSTTMGAFWCTIPHAIEGAPRVGRWICRLGIFSTAAMITIFFMPSDQFPKLHGIAITAAAGPGLLALALGVWTLGGRGRPLALRVSGWALLTFATANFVVYSREYWLDLPGSPVLPVLQKIATLCAIVWMTLVVAHAWNAKATSTGADAR